MWSSIRDPVWGGGFVCSTPFSAFRFCIFGNLSKQRAKQSSPENKVSLKKQTKPFYRKAREEVRSPGQEWDGRVPTDRQPWCTREWSPQPSSGGGSKPPPRH